MSSYSCPSNKEASNIIFHHFRNNKTQTVNYKQDEHNVYYKLNYMFFDEQNNEDNTKKHVYIETFKEFIEKYIEQYRLGHNQGSLTHWQIFESKDIICSINECILDRLMEKHKEPITPNNTPREGIIIMEEIERNCFSLQFLFEMITYDKTIN